jgi:hypothetical protein
MARNRPDPNIRLRGHYHTTFQCILARIPRMKNIQQLLRKALAAVSPLAILPVALAVACSDGAPTNTPTLQIAPTHGLTRTTTPSRYLTTNPAPTTTLTSAPSTNVPQSTVLHMPPPVVGIDTGKGTLLVEPELLAILATHAAGGNGSSGQLRVILAWDDSTSATADFIISQGGVRETDTYDPDCPWADRIWRIPAESMLAVVQHPDVWTADLWKDGQKEQRQRPRHPKLNRTANLVVTVWNLGVPAENAAQYALFPRGDRVLISMDVGNGPDFEELITWLESEEVYLLDKVKEPVGDGLGGVSVYGTVALTPVSVIAAAAQRDDVVAISAEGYSGQSAEMQRHYWPPQAVWYEDTWVDEFVPEGQKVGRPKPD